MSGVSMPRESTEESDREGDEKDTEGGEVLVAVAAPPIQQEVDWRPLLQRLEQAEGEGKCYSAMQFLSLSVFYVRLINSKLNCLILSEVNIALQDVEGASYRMPGMLRNFVEPIGSLLLSPSNSIRNLSHTLLARYWKHDPSAAAGGAALRIISKCLDSNQPEVVATALDRLPDVVLSVQGTSQFCFINVFFTPSCKAS